jgi:hypothetical protein
VLPISIFTQIGIILSTIAIVGFLGYRAGIDSANVDCLKNVRDTAIKYAEYANAAVEETRSKLEKENAANVAREQRKTILASRQIKERIVYANTVQDRIECSMPADTYKLLNDAIDRANTTLGFGEADSVRGSVPTNSEANKSE